MDVVRSFHTQASRGTHSSRYIPFTNPYQVREIVNSIEDVEAALTQGVYTMQARRHLNDTAGMCPLTCLHVHCFNFLAGPPQALELNPVEIVTEVEAIVLLTDHEVFAKHNKCGIFLVPQSFLKWNGPSDQHHTLDTSALDQKRLSDVKVENTEAADKTAGEAAGEKMKR
eukprot:scaffold130627_cov72-Phaeocystis_antarctica.AAC.1